MVDAPPSGNVEPLCDPDREVVTVMGEDYVIARIQVSRAHLLLADKLLDVMLGDDPMPDEMVEELNGNDITQAESLMAYLLSEALIETVGDAIEAGSLPVEVVTDLISQVSDTVQESGAGD
jgi:hypothetical protein